MCGMGFDYIASMPLLPASRFFFVFGCRGVFFVVVSRSWSFLLTVVLSDFGVLVRGGPSTLPSRLQHLGFSIVF